MYIKERKKVIAFSKEARNRNLWFNNNLKLLRQTDHRRHEREEAE